MTISKLLKASKSSRAFALPDHPSTGADILIQHTSSFPILSFNLLVLPGRYGTSRKGDGKLSLNLTMLAPVVWMIWGAGWTRTRYWVLSVSVTCYIMQTIFALNATRRSKCFCFEWLVSRRALMWRGLWHYSCQMLLLLLPILVYEMAFDSISTFCSYLERFINWQNVCTQRPH